MGRHSDAAAEPRWNPDYKLNRTALFFFGLCLSAIYIVGDLQGHGRQGAGAGVAVGVLLFALRVNWNHRRYLWFWTAFISGVVVQVPFILYFPPLLKNGTFAIIFPMMLLDYAVVHGFLKASYMLAKWHSQGEGAASKQ